MPDYDLGRARGKVEIDSSGVKDSFDDAADSVEGFKEQVEDTDEPLRKHEENTRRSTKANDSFIDSLKRSQPRIKGLAIGFLVNGLVALVAAAAPAVGILATLPNFLVAAALPVGVLASAFGGMGDALKAAFDDSKEGAEKFREELDKLPPPAQKFVLVVKDMIPQLRKLRDIAQRGILPQAAESLQALGRTYLPLVSDAFYGTAEVIDDFMERAAHLVTDPAFTSDMERVFNAGIEIFHQFGRAGLSIIDVLVQLAAVSAPYAEKLAELAARGAHAAQTFVEQARASGELKAFLDRAYHVTVKLVEILGNLTGAVLSLINQLQPIGDPFLNSLDALAIALGNFFTALGQNTTLLESFSGSVVLVLNALTSLLNAFSSLSPQTQAIIAHFISLAIVAGTILKAFNLAFTGVLKLKTEFDRLKGVLVKVGGFFAPVFRAVGRLGPLFARLGPLVARVGPFFGTLAGFIGRLGPVFARILPFILRFVPLIARVGVVLLGLATGPVGIVIAVLTALGIAFFIAYQKSETFRNIVQSVFRTIGTVVSTVVGSIIGFIQRLIAVFQAEGLSGIGARIANALRTAGQAILSFFASLPERIAFAIGFIIGRMLRFQIMMIAAAVRLGAGVVGAIVRFFAQLPGRVSAFLSAVLSRAASWGASMISTAVRVGSAVLSAIVRFLAQLPGRVASFMSRALAAVARFAVSAPARARAAGSAILRGIVSFVQQLPGRVQSFMSRAVAAVSNAASRAAAAARRFGSSVLSAIRSGLAGLPGLVSGLMGRAVDAISGMASAAFARAKSVASSLWNGFKSGLGIESPSYIERAMFAIRDSIDDTTAHMLRTVRTWRGPFASLAQRFKVAQSGINHHAKLLREAFLDDSSRKGFLGAGAEIIDHMLGNQGKFYNLGRSLMAEFLRGFKKGQVPTLKALQDFLTGKFMTRTTLVTRPVSLTGPRGIATTTRTSAPANVFDFRGARFDGTSAETIKQVFSASALVNQVTFAARAR